jgi:hypothetical protein
MDADLKAKWVEALRSGEYEQGSLYLRKEGKHCCLGVLCELADIEISEGGVMVAAQPYKTDDYEPIYEIIGGSGVARELWRRNDGNGERKHSFAEIADYIEANL